MTAARRGQRLTPVAASAYATWAVYLARAAVAALALVMPLTGCSYAAHRGQDLLDVIDLKGGRSMGLGAKLEATLYLGAGLGGAGLGQTYEWYGRQRVDTVPDTSGLYDNGLFIHILIVGFDVNTVHGGPPAKDSLNIVAFNRAAFADHTSPPLLDRARFGGELVLPFVAGGLYLNVGQAIDFVLGITTLDIAGDDGLGQHGADWNRGPPAPPPLPEPSPLPAPHNEPDDEPGGAAAGDGGAS
ncbi:MAG: hypothetical protein DRQ55_05795 [Planctomycetota bacterium]|nr:MAG: hypothetical protein DRQ55_05795 [Planctomycetota bacterium]